MAKWINERARDIEKQVDAYLAANQRPSGSRSQGGHRKSSGSDGSRKGR